MDGIGCFDDVLEGFAIALERIKSMMHMQKSLVCKTSGSPKQISETHRFSSNSCYLSPEPWEASGLHRHPRGFRLRPLDLRWPHPVALAAGRRGLRLALCGGLCGVRGDAAGALVRFGGRGGGG